MAPYQICNTCIMDTSDSTISFDNDGQCIYCNNFNNVILPNWNYGKDGEERLAKIARKISREGIGKEFDCIIGISGGLDSSYLAYIAKEKLGLKPLLFHVDAGWNTDKAVGNIEKLVDGLGLDLFTEVIDWEEMKDLQVALLRSQIAHQDIPQDTAFFSTLYKFARIHKIKYILTGGNFSTECIREPEEWGAYPGVDRRMIMGIHSMFGKNKLETFPIVDVFISKIFYKYFLGMQVVKPLDLIQYNKKEAESKLNEIFGWEKFQHKHHESRFTRFFEDYWLPKKFGFDRRRAHFSSLILTNQLSRIEALDRISQPELDSHFLECEFEYIANKLDLGVENLEKIFHGKNKSSSNYKSKRKIIEISAKIMRLLGVESRLYK
jgi:N-acetyl sugar amidotransferase